MRVSIPAVMMTVGGSTFAVPYLRLLRDLAYLPWGVLRFRVAASTRHAGFNVVHVDDLVARAGDLPTDIFFGPQLPGWAEWMRTRCP